MESEVSREPFLDDGPTSEDPILSSVFGRGEPLIMSKGQLLYGAGDPARGIYGIHRGIVKLYALSPRGKQVVYSFEGAGELFGELALVDGDHDHFAEAREDGELRLLSREALVDLFASRPEAGLALARRCGARARRFSRLLANCFFRTARARVAQALVKLADDHGVVDSRGVLLDIELNQEELGGLVGVSRERVCATLAVLRRCGLVERRGGKLRILDLARLAETR